MNKKSINRTKTILATANNLRWEIGEDFHDKLMESIYENAAQFRAMQLRCQKKNQLAGKKTLIEY